MKVRFRLFALAFCIFVNSQAEDAPKPYWVLADLAQIRKEPKAGASVLGTLTTGTQLQVNQVLPDWVYVDSTRDASIGGWVHKSLVTDTLVDQKFILKRIAGASDEKETLKWAERLAALLPHETNRLQTLQSRYAALGDTAKANLLGRRLRGTEEVYLARIEGEELLVIGVLDSNGGFQSLLWQATRSESDHGKFTQPLDSASHVRRKKALDMRISLTARKWYGWDDHESFGTRFHTAGISQGLNFDVEDTGIFGISFGKAVDAFKRSYGRALFATKPFRTVPTMGLRRKADWDSLAGYRKKLVGKAFDSSGVQGVDFQSLDDYGFVDLTLRGTVLPGWRHPNQWSQRGIFDRSRKLVWPPEHVGGNEGFGDALAGLFQKVPPRWFRFGENADSPAFIILPFSTDPPANFRNDVEDGSRFGEYGIHLLRVKKDGFKFFLVHSSYAGC